MKNLIHKIQKWPKKYMAIGLILLLVVASFIFYSTKSAQKPAEVATVRRGNLLVEVSAAGTLSGQKLIPLRFQTSGKLAQVNFKEGDRVYAGQILANLDNREQSIALQQTQNTLRDREAQVDKVLDDIHLFQYGMSGFANIGTENETMTQRQLRTTAEVARDNAYDGVKLAQKALEDSLIIAPVTGVVTEVNFIPGQIISTQDVVIRMIDNLNIYFDAEVDEVDIGKVWENQKAEITLDAYEQIFEGAVDQIIPQTKQTLSGATVVIVRIKFFSLPVFFINGLTGESTIITEQANNVLTIPREALGDDNTVVVQSEDGLKSRRVTTGIYSDIDIEIKEGLNEGEKILLNPPAIVNGQNSSGNPSNRIHRFLRENLGEGH